MSLRVLSTGTFSLLVDQGRPNSRRRGLPLGGPADRRALALGNTLVGNAPTTTALEITLSGPTLLAEVDVGLCVIGAPFTLQVEDHPYQTGETFTLRVGQTLRIGGTGYGCRAYVCVVGGFHSPTVLGSQTGFAPLTSDIVLRCSPSSLAHRRYTPDIHETAWSWGSAVTLRCLAGPQADWFDGAFWSTTYTVLPASNRMGVRLEGSALVKPARELVSEAVAPGAVQITNDGKPIILGVDGQTIGGYPKIAHVIDADLDKLGQLRPNTLVRFVQLNEAEAEEQSGLYRQRLKRTTRYLQFALQS